MSVTLIALSGSLKQDSWNQKLVDIAALAAKQTGAKIIDVRLADYPMPLFSEDLEAESVPEAVIALKEIFAKADGILVASPEYNASLTGVLKNTIDWLSRPGGSRPVGSDTRPVFAGKALGLMAASPGGLGGLRGLSHARDILFALGMQINTQQVNVSSAFNAFDEAGNLVDASKAEAAKQLGVSTVWLAEQIQIPESSTLKKTA